MMRFDIISLFPEMFDSLNSSIPAIAQQKQLISLHYWNPRDYTNSKHGNVDDRPYGGGPGMVMQYQPLRDCINAAKQVAGENSRVIYLSPQGKCFNQQLAQVTAQHKQNLILLCGRYEGIDERVIDSLVDEEWSIGDFVVSGGELPAMLVIDAVTRLLPDALGHADSAVQDSFQHGLLDHPHYTRPEIIDGLSVPNVLLKGDHAKIKAWRHDQAQRKTWQKRPDLVQSATQNLVSEQSLTGIHSRDGQEIENE
ncbi:MAG: tRNA (guanosine(37)-N1)-methyltransferase TrmD [Coxiellaceae bacterium]|nr:tRNA (guanosine(37)-N1)-methyltransferase TrmD [Coxiellaceae bacterium]